MAGAFWGMVTNEAEAHVATIGQRARELERIALQLADAVGSAHWEGPDAQDFRDRAQQVDADLARAVEDLDGRGRQLEEHIDEQEQASDPLGYFAEQIFDMFGFGGPDPLQSLSTLGAPESPYDIDGDDIAPIGEDRISRPDNAVDPETPADLMTNLQQSANASTEDAQNIRIQQVVGPDGKSTYVVYVPGSYGPEFSRVAPGTPDRGANPFDWNQNYGAINGQSTDSSRAVAAAMEAAGVPHGSDVVFVAHSQGGAVANNLAGDPSFNAPNRYNVTDVISVGAPVDGSGPLDGTTAMNFNHQTAMDEHGNVFLGDPVPETDGLRAVDPIIPKGYQESQERYEIGLDASRPGGNFGMDNHNIDRYSESITREVAENPHGRTAEYFQSDRMQDILGPDAHVVDSVDVRVSREDGTYEE
ncbi:hypothetical protein [Brachybacterium sp. Marseille-Q7125]|uniref:hypothetical protein n=1 Tax=Brachybacterium sp. Marseille-Q7125 TaxID=2932815 RepID=UPI001FF61BEB|nr:hypothetical protein [Brachybacterium sp. Marseille-Q7125]